MDIIVDIDGTVANIEHRLPLIAGPKKDWDAFFEACDLDVSIQPVVELVESLIGGGNTVVFCTGRPERIRHKTIEWLTRRVGRPAALFMRKDGDHRPDHLVKEEMLAQIRTHGYDPKLAIDDREQVVQMWRRNGLVCAQVADGKY